MAKVLIVNMAPQALSLDVTLGVNVIRRNIATGGSIDIGDVATIEAVNQSPVIKELVAAGTIQVLSLADPTDVAEGTKLVVSGYLMAPELADTDGIVTSTNWANGPLTIAGQPDVARNITAVLTDTNNSCTGLLTITGVDPAGRPVVEVMRPNGAGAGKTLTGTKIFAQVTSCVLSGCAGGTPSTDVVVIGYGNVVGLPSDIQATTAVKSVYLGDTRQASPTIKLGTSTSGVDASAGTYDGTKPLVVVYNTGE